MQKRRFKVTGKSSVPRAFLGQCLKLSSLFSYQHTIVFFIKWRPWKIVLWLACDEFKLRFSGRPDQLIMAWVMFVDCECRLACILFSALFRVSWVTWVDLLACTSVWTPAQPSDGGFLSLKFKKLGCFKLKEVELLWTTIRKKWCEIHGLYRHYRFGESFGEC